MRSVTTALRNSSAHLGYCCETWRQCGYFNNLRASAWTSRSPNMLLLHLKCAVTLLCSITLWLMMFQLQRAGSEGEKNLLGAED